MTSVATVKSRLMFWNDHPVPGGYDESAYTAGADGAQYRQDCSGYVSMLLGLHDNPYTGAMVGAAYTMPIGKTDLRFGDVLIALAGNGWDAGHVVMFDSWTDGTASAYHAHEFGWGAAPAHRVVTYPYNDPGAGQDSRTFRPFRLRALDWTAPPPPPSAGGTYTVRAGDTLSAIALDVLGDAARYTDIAALNGIAAPYVIAVGQVLKMPLVLTGGGGSSAPSKPPGPAVQHGPLFGRPVPALIARGTGQYFGSYSGPNASHGGFVAAERPTIKLLEQQIIFLGYVPGVPRAAWATSTWADGYFDNPTDRPGTGPMSQAVKAFQRDHMPNTQFPGQVWWDDWAKLATF